MQFFINVPNGDEIHNCGICFQARHKCFKSKFSAEMYKIHFWVDLEIDFVTYEVRRYPWKVTV